MPYRSGFYIIIICSRVGVNVSKFLIDKGHEKKIMLSVW